MHPIESILPVMNHEAQDGATGLSNAFSWPTLQIMSFASTCQWTRTHAFGKPVHVILASLLSRLSFAMMASEEDVASHVRRFRTLVLITDEEIKSIRRFFNANVSSDASLVTINRIYKMSPRPWVLPNWVCRFPSAALSNIVIYLHRASQRRASIRCPFWKRRLTSLMVVSMKSVSGHTEEMVSWHAIRDRDLSRSWLLLL